jgi:hypothetical protein
MKGTRVVEHASRTRHALIKINNRRRMTMAMDEAKKNERVYKMKFASVYPMYVQKAEKKGRTQAEVDTVICWLTGYDNDGLQAQLKKEADIASFFTEAPLINPNAGKITGVVCGIRVELIVDPLIQKVRWLDKLIDELAKGKSMEKVLRG